jgi:hypothetical protein
MSYIRIVFELQVRYLSLSLLSLAVFARSMTSVQMWETVTAQDMLD